MAEEQQGQEQNAAQAAGHVDLGRAYAIDGDAVSSAGADDEVSWVVRGPDGEIKVKGPDPAVWGDPSERPLAASDQASSGGLAIGEIINEGTPEEVKGPGEYWRGRHYEPEAGY